MGLFSQFLWSFIHTKICRMKVVRHKIIIGGSSNFGRGQHVDFCAKVFVDKRRYSGNFWARVAYRYGGKAFSIHAKRKLREQENMNIM